MKEIDYYKNNEILENSYYQIPQELFVNGLYKEKLNSDSKILYAFLLDRLSLSQKNHWFDEFGRVYLIFTREEVQDKLYLSEKTVTKAFKQLADVNLIAEKRQELGKPNLIYVGKIQHEEIVANIEQENIQVLNSKNYSSGEVKNTTLDMEILPTINPNNIKTNIINTDSINLQSNDECISLNKVKEKYNLKGQIRSNSNIMCEMVFTSDQKFFDEIGYEESKRYFKESYDFICKYKNLREQNIISAVVHMDEDTPHMHLLFIPVVHTTDKQGNKIDKVCCRGKNSYRDLQNAYFKHISEKGFNLERGELVEVTNREHYSVQEFKQITNFENTKKVLESITLDLPETPNIKDIRKVMINRDEKIENEIIKPRDDLIQELYKENISLRKELSKQSNTVEMATEYEKKHTQMLEDNINLKFKCKKLEETLENKEKELKQQFEHETYKIDYQYQKIINKLEKENNYLKKVIDRFKTTVQKFITWVCHKFSYPSEEDLIRNFEKETYINFNIEKQLDLSKFEKKEKEDELEL